MLHESGMQIVSMWSLSFTPNIVAHWRYIVGHNSLGMHSSGRQGSGSDVEVFSASLLNKPDCKNNVASIHDKSAVMHNDRTERTHSKRETPGELKTTQSITRWEN